jgi:hypothetical protein
MCEQSASAAELLSRVLLLAAQDAARFEEARIARERALRMADVEGDAETRLQARLDMSTATVNMCDICARVAASLDRSTAALAQLRESLALAFEELDRMREQSRASLESLERDRRRRDRP